MYVERVRLTNFRCFGPELVDIALDEGLTAFVGTNASGKTAALLGMLRLFGVSQDARRVRVDDFHVPADEDVDHRPPERSLSVEVVLAFPELADADEDSEAADSVPEFFHQMVADHEGILKCRIRLSATWTHDGSVAGAITEERHVIRTLAADFEDDDCSILRAVDRARIQMIYVPAARDGAQHLTAFLRGRLWRAAKWSGPFQDTVRVAAKDLNAEFGDELAVSKVRTVLQDRWTELHSAGTDANPEFRPVSVDFSQFVGHADLYFQPTETGQPRRADELSDGQRSLLHIALTATTLDVEGDIVSGEAAEQFDRSRMVLPTLTILAVEEPENSLSPFYLSRIVTQMLELGRRHRAQMVLSSHSASVLGRVEPTAVRHFRLDVDRRTALVNAIQLPDDDDEASKYVREAVRAYPELYFARFVVLGEGDSEQVVLPLLAAARDLAIDRSFVAVVPLGGRHVNHLWRLLDQLCIPHATLLDLDQGRVGGGVERVAQIHGELVGMGIEVVPTGTDDAGGAWDIAGLTPTNLDRWIGALRTARVYFCRPLDLDWTLMQAFPSQYKQIVPGGRAPSSTAAATAVLGEGADDSVDDAYLGQDEALRWYRYLFLSRSKPSTHLRVLSGMTEGDLASGCPEELTALLDHVKAAIG